MYVVRGSDFSDWRYVDRLASCCWLTRRLSASAHIAPSFRKFWSAHVYDLKHAQPIVLLSSTCGPNHRYECHRSIDARIAVLANGPVPSHVGHELQNPEIRGRRLLRCFGIRTPAKGEAKPVFKSSIATLARCAKHEGARSSRPPGTRIHTRSPKISAADVARV